MARQVLSLFCGAGGLDHGFFTAGFETVLALDNWQAAIDTFNCNARSPVAKVADLASLTASEFLSLIPKEAAPIGLIGGPPCQGFSRGNVSANPDDPRNHLPFRYANLLKAANGQFNLHFFVFENVAGLLGPKHAKRFELIRRRLTSAGFNVFYKTLDASQYGVPQRRKRLFIVGLNSTLYPDTSFDFPPSSADSRTVADVIAGLPEPAFYVRNAVPEDFPVHPNHWTMVPKSKKFARQLAADGRSFKRLQWDKVSPTVAYGNREIHVHPEGLRRLSIYEAMLLQGFPPTFRLTGSLSAQVTQVSNAVPPPIAHAIAERLKNIIRLAKSKSARVTA